MQLQGVTEAEFLSAPVGRFVLGRSFLAWCATPRLCGGVTWGSPSLSEVEQMMRLHDVFDRPGVSPPMGVVIDARRLKAIRADAFDAYVRVIGPKVVRYRKLIRRQALLLPHGIVGSTFIGFYALVGPLFPRHRVFRHEEHAAQWLGGDAAEAVREVAAVAARARAPADGLVELDRYLREHHSDTTLERACQHLGVSQRTLQRQLDSAGTTFRTELTAARLEAAHSLLGEATDKLELVARRIGFHTAAHFCAWFRRHTGRTPGQFRQTAS